MAKWINFSDIGDLIAIPRDLTQRFRGVDDHNPAVRINAFDFHKVVNYLNNPQVRQALEPYLR